MKRRRWGPWTQTQTAELRRDVRTYFETYYAALRDLVVEHDEAADLPGWLKGGREITASLCTDGVVVVHVPYERESQTYPERENSYSFNAVPTKTGYSAGRLVHENYATEVPGGRKLGVMPEYADGEDFGVFVRLWPAHEPYTAPDDYQIDITSHWTRLDAISRSNLNVWRSEMLARHQAEAAVRPYLEGEGPIPRPLR